MSPSAETDRREDVLLSGPKRDRRRENHINCAGPTTVSEDRTAQDFYEAACSLLVWHRLPSQKQCLTGESGLFLGAMAPFTVFSWRLHANDKKSRNGQVDQSCLCRNSGQKRRRNDVGEGEADTAAATAPQHRQQRTIAIEEWHRQAYVTAISRSAKTAARHTRISHRVREGPHLVVGHIPQEGQETSRVRRYLETSQPSGVCRDASSNMPSFQKSPAEFRDSHRNRVYASAPRERQSPREPL